MPGTDEASAALRRLSAGFLEKRQSDCGPSASSGLLAAAEEGEGEREKGREGK